MKKLAPLGIFLLVSIVYYWKIFFKGYVAFPGDLLVGAYYPWYQQIPVKNPLGSDVFSQFFIWKSLISESYRNLSLPLWNPYSYFGQPLLANFHSGSLNPFNILFVIFGDITGWNLFVILQRVLSGFTMYIFLQNHLKDYKPAIAGGLLYCMSPFMTAWVQFGTMGWAMVWLPLIFTFIEKYLKTDSIKMLFPLPILFFLLITAGQFQAVIFGTIFSTLYFAFLLFTDKKQGRIKKNLFFLATGLLSLGISAVQLLPTLEWLNHSVRPYDNYAVNYNFGLLPLKNIFTLLSPDYFGNPATGNFFGFYNYHETLVFSGVLSVFVLIASILNYKKLSIDRFFMYSCLAIFILIFDSPISKATYLYEVPFISTGVAGRLVMVLVFSLSVLAAKMLAISKKLPLKKVLVPFGLVLAMFAFLALISESQISTRNLIFPFLVFCAISFSFLFRKTKIFLPLIIIIIFVDLARFGWKYEPVVPSAYVFPATESTSFLTKQDGVFRIEREQGPIMSPNTWSYYRLQSGAGYDPMAPLSSTLYYHKNYNNLENNITRYSELYGHNIDAEKMGEDSVKYLLLLNRNEDGGVDPNGVYLNNNVNNVDWISVYRGEGISVLENKLYKPRVESKTADVNILEYEPNQVTIWYKSDMPSDVILKDTYAPGWTAYFNERNYKITRFKDVFRKVTLPEGEGELEFIYEPKGVTYGLAISFVSLIVWIYIILINKKAEG